MRARSASLVMFSPIVANLMGELAAPGTGEDGNDYNRREAPSTAAVKRGSKGRRASTYRSM